MNQVQAHLTVPVSDRDHIAGPDHAPVTLVEYGDYECPYCGQAYPIVRAAQQQLGDRLRFVFRNFPLTNAHPHAEGAAEAAEAAAAQGQFWPMDNLLYEHQHALAAPDLRRYAERIGLDLARFDEDMRDHRYAERVREDFMSGVRSGVNGTPTFFINGDRYDGSWDADTLIPVLEDAAG